MNRLARLPKWYSIVSVSIGVLVLLLMLTDLFFHPASPGFHDLLFFFLLTAYLNCLPLAIVSIFLFFRRKELRRYCLFNFAAIIVVLYFAVRVFGHEL